MPATPNVIPSVDLALRAAGNIVGLATGGTLTANRANDEAHHDLSANWMVRTSGVSSWSVSADGLLDTAGGDIVTGHAPGAVLRVGIGGDDVKGLTEAGVSLSLNVAEVVNAFTGMTRTLDPAARSCEVSLSFDYYDPAAAGSAAFAAVLDYLLGVTDDPLAVTLEVAGLSLAFDAVPTTSALTKSAGEVLKAGVTLAAAGPVTNNSAGLGAGVAGLLAAFFGADRSAALGVLVGTGVADNTEFEGDAFPSSIGITVPYAGQATTSVTLEGTGPLVRRATAA